MNKVKRYCEVKRLKREIKEMLAVMGVSINTFNKTVPKMKARGYKYYVDGSGKKPSLRQRWQFLTDLRKFKENKDKEEAEKTNEK